MLPSRPGVAGNVMCQTHSLWRSRPEGVPLSAPDARKSQSFLQKQKADTQSEFVRSPADCSPLQHERLPFLTNDPGMSMKTNSREVDKLRSREVAGPMQQEVGSYGEGLSLLNPRFSTPRLELDGTKRECL